MLHLAGATGCFTTKNGGVSVAPYATFNLGDHVGDDPGAVAQNREILARQWGQIAWMTQTHSTRIQRVYPERQSPYQADGLIVDSADFAPAAAPALAVMVADCLPLLLASTDGTKVAAVHVGRAGLHGGIIISALAAFASLGVDPGDIHAALGPSICGNCYEVSEELREQVSTHRPRAYSNSRWNTPAIDIPAAALAELESAGVNVAYRARECTFENENYFSYRRAQATGRFVGLIRPAPARTR